MPRALTSLLALVAGVHSCLPSRAQPGEGAEIFSEMIQHIIRQKTNPALSRDEIRKAIQQQLARSNVFAAFSLGKEEFQFLVETYRLDKQIGAGSASGGSTTLVSAGSVPSLLGLAVETGALLRSASGNSITFRTNPMGLAKALVKQSYQASGPHTDLERTLRVLRRFSIAATFDTSRGPQPGTLRANYKQLSEFSTRVDLWNRRDPRHPAYLARWGQFLRSTPGERLANDSKKLSDLIHDTSNPDLESKADALAEAAADKLLAAEAGQEAVKKIFLEYAEALAEMIRHDERLRDAARRVLGSWRDYVREQKQIYTAVANSPIVTLEYALVRPPSPAATTGPGTGPQTPAGNPSLPDLSSFRLIYSQKFIDTSEVTLNAALSLFNRTLPTTRGSIRDFQVGGRLDIPLPEIQRVGKGSLTFSGLFVRLRQQPLGVPFLVSGRRIDQAGNLGLFQVQYSIPVRDTGVRIPLSFAYASRTELLMEREIRGNFGLTFDLDKLFARP